MATSRPGYQVPYADLASALLATSEVVPRARLIAEQAVNLVPDGAAVVYVLDEQQSFVPKATAGEVAFQEVSIEGGGSTLGEVAERKEPVVWAGSALPREAYSHLNVRRTLASLAALPLLLDERMIGAIEVLSFEESIGDATLAALSELSTFTARGLASSIAYESERNTQLQSITRITQMYDLEKVFNATLEMDQLLPVITAKFQDILAVQAVNLWMVEGEALLLMHRTGSDEAYELEARQAAGEGIAAAVSDSGEPLLIAAADDERLQQRNARVQEGAVFSLMAAPVIHEQAVVGVVEAINKFDGTAFDEDDLFLLSTICETASNALHNASLLQAERKVEILETLVRVTTQIAATLDLETVLDAVVNEPSAVIPYQRAAISLEQRGRMQLKAVSGMPQINPSDPQVVRLRDILEWASFLGEEVHVTARDGEIDAERPETRAKFEEYFRDTGVRSFYAIPLADDQGRVGILSFESSDSDFLTSAHLEMIKILVGQATVAVRNASLYREVPLIGVIEPLMQRKQKFMAMEKRRRQLYLALAGAVVVFLVVVPLPMRLDGDATVAPARSAQVQPEVGGVVSKVHVREGDPVQPGTVLAELEDWEYRAAAASAQAKYNTAISEANRALATNDGTEAGIQRVQADFWRSELSRARERLERTRLRSPIAGVVATPHIQNLVGRRLNPGDTLAEVVDSPSSHATVDVAIDEFQVALLQAGTPASIKLDALPLPTFKGEVTVVSPRSVPAGDHRNFYARVTVTSPKEDVSAIRPGMQGRGKIWVGWRPAGYVMFRRTGIWLWNKFWGWFGG